MLENPKVNVKIRLSALWASLIALYIYGDYFELYVPGKVEDLLEGNNVLDSPMTLLAASILIAIPSLMIALSVLVKPTLNRILNMVFGLLLMLVVILVGISSIDEWHTFYVLYAFLEALVSLTIVWTAWKWPKA
jgi:hypothetical protein